MKRFIKCKRGLSTVVGAVFCVLVILMGFSFILWEATQYDSYIDSVNERNRLDQERASEIIEIISVSISNDKLNVSVQNQGAVAAHLVSLWITNSSVWHENFPIDYYLNPGNTVIDIGQDLPPDLDSDLNYGVKVVTERGNIDVSTYSPDTYEPPPSVHAFGVFSLDWFYFKHRSSQNPEPTDAGVISKEEDYVSFYVKVTNNYDEVVTLKSTSMIMLLIEYQEPLFYITEDVSYPTSAWKPTDWDFVTYIYHSGSYSICADSSATTLTSTDLETSDATNVTVSFWYRDQQIDDNDNVYLQFWNGSTYNDIFELGNTNPEYTWHEYTLTTSDPQYLVSDFHIRFEASGIDNDEYLWIDDVEIKKMAGEEVILLSDGFESTLPSIIEYDDGNPITIAPNESHVLIFAAETASTANWKWSTTWPIEPWGSTPEGAIVMTALVFTIGESLQIQAQSLPFQALVLSGD